jgi:hypothetical protein
MSGRRFKEALEVVTSIMVIAGIILFGFVSYRILSHHPAESAQVAPEGPAVGTVLPALPGYNWQQHSETLLLAIRKGCHFCEDSMPFYRKLLQAERNGDSKAFLVSVLSRWRYRCDTPAARRAVRCAGDRLVLLGSIACLCHAHSDSR